MKNILAIMACALSLAFSNGCAQSCYAQSIVTTHGGTVIAHPAIHAIFDGDFDPVLQARLTMMVKDFAGHPSPTLVNDYVPQAAGSLIETRNIGATSNLDIGSASAVVQEIYGPKGFLSLLLSKIFGRTGSGADTYVIFAAPGIKVTLNGQPVSGFHSWLTFRKGLVIVVTYDPNFNNESYSYDHEGDEAFADPLGNCFYGANLDQEICDLCPWDEWTDTINGIIYTRAKVFDNKTNACK